MLVECSNSCLSAVCAGHSGSPVMGPRKGGIHAGGTAITTSNGGGYSIVIPRLFTGYRRLLPSYRRLLQATGEASAGY